MSNTVLKLDNVSMQFGGVRAVDQLSITVDKGSIVGLIGPNGAGKTTVFNTISGFYIPTEGDIFFEGQNITKLPPHETCRTGIARTFQNIRLFPSSSSLQNVMVGAHVRQKSKWWMAPLGLDRKEEKRLREESLDLLRRLDLEKESLLPAGSLPYGAQRRLEIARALATHPRFLLLDEPAAGMNPQESLALMGLIRNIQRDFDLTILLIEHDMKVVMGICANIFVLENGALIASGDADAIKNNPRVIEAYLGEDYLNYA